MEMIDNMDNKNNKNENLENDEVEGNETGNEIEEVTENAENEIDNETEELIAMEENENFNESEEIVNVEKNEIYNEYVDSIDDVENDSSEEGCKDSKEVKKKNNIVEWAKTIIIPIVIALLILQVIRPTLVQQQSMLPTVEPNDYLIVYKLAYKIGEPKTGDIVVFESELKLNDDTNKYLIKRVIATEGQTIQVTDGEVYVNGNQLDESYINGDYTPGDVPLTVVPDDCIFVMGDNRPNSTDSRDPRVGFVDMDTVMGKVVVRLFPFNKMGSLYD